MSDVNLPDRPSVDYEKSDVAAGGVLAFVAGLILLGLLVHAIVAGLFDYLGHRENSRDPPLPPLAARERIQLPRDLEKIPPPRLQQSEPADLVRLRASEDEILTTYGWVNRETRTVRIPIEEAMRLLADPKTAAAKGVRTRAEKQP